MPHTAEIVILSLLKLKDRKQHVKPLFDCSNSGYLNKQ